MTIDYESLTIRNPVAVVSKREWQALPKLGVVNDRLQSFVHYSVRRYEGKRVVMQSGEYGSAPYLLFDIDAK